MPRRLQRDLAGVMSKELVAISREWLVHAANNT